MMKVSVPFAETILAAQSTGGTLKTEFLRSTSLASGEGKMVKSTTNGT